MNDNRIEEIENQLASLGSFSDILGTAVVDRNGILALSKFPRTTDPRKIAAISAMIYKAIGNVIDLIKENKISNLLLEFDKNQLIILEIDLNYLLLALIEVNVNLGLVLIELEEVINKLNLKVKYI